MVRDIAAEGWGYWLHCTNRPEAKKENAGLYYETARPASRLPISSWKALPTKHLQHS